MSARLFFERPASTFAFEPRMLGWILADEANPLNCISGLIQEGATVLDVGAGNGVLAQLVAARGKSVRIDAVEPDPAASVLARGNYGKFWELGVAEFLQVAGSVREHYDVIVLADVLEHLPNPDSVLLGLRPLLRAGGRVIVSVPNVSFMTVRLALLDGAFDYVDSGLLERTHLRFYTLKTLLQLFLSVDLHVSGRWDCRRSPLDTEIAIDGISVSPLVLRRLAKDELAFVYQFVFVLEAESTRSPHKIALGAVDRSFMRHFLVKRFKRICKEFCKKGHS